MVSTAAFHARVRGSVPGFGGLKETKLFLPHPRVKVSIVGSLRDREVACSASDRQGSNFESCVWRTVSSQSSHHPQEVLLAQFSLYVHKGGLKPDSFHFIYLPTRIVPDHPGFFLLVWRGNSTEPTQNCMSHTAAEWVSWCPIDKWQTLVEASTNCPWTRTGYWQVRTLFSEELLIMSEWLLLYIALYALSQYDILCQYIERRNDGYHFKQYSMFFKKLISL